MSAAEDLTDHYATLAAELAPPAAGQDPAPPEPTDDELRAVWANAATHSAAQIEPRAAYAKSCRDKGLDDVRPVIDGALRALGVTPTRPDDGTPAKPVYRCDGACGAIVMRRGDWCRDCAAKNRYVACDIALSEARRSVNPEGSRDWCKPGEDAYQRAMMGTKINPGAKALYWKLPDDDKSLAEGEQMFKRAEWTGASMLLLGPTGIGKTALMSAICNNLLERAREGKLTPDEFKTACGLRWVSAVELTRAPSLHRLGEGEAPLIRMAKRAPILVIDELGKVDNNPEIIMEVLRARYEPQWRPTFVASELTLDALNLRYGASTLRGVWQRGRLLDLHPRAAATTAPAR